MRRIALIAPALLSACATVPAAPPVHGEIPGRICNAAGTDRFIGQEATSEVGSEILRATNSAKLRWAAPGMMLTMDFSPSRVTVRIDPAHKVSAINCG